MLDLYRKVSRIQGVKNVFISSGIRYDMLLAKTGRQETDANNQAYLREVVSNHVSGRLKVAPEHTSDEVLKIMRKPSFALFRKFKQEFDTISKQANLNQQVVPYFISGHPGCTLEDMAVLAVEAKKLGLQLEQVQDFTPTPMTLATVIYYSGYHPYTMEKVVTARSRKEKLDQRQFFFWYKNEYRNSIVRALRFMKREDLIQQLFGS